jgi:hypothetical protein
VIVGIESGKRRVFAAALEWPGWCRSGRDEVSALETLVEYAERYGPVAARAGLAFDPDTTSLEVTERVTGSSATDFGVPYAQYSWDSAPSVRGEWERTASLLEASYGYFDGVVAAAPLELRKGPRGGGRDRDKIVAHVNGADVEYGRKLGLERWKPETADGSEIAHRRRLVVEVFRTARDASPRTEKGWNLRYAARRGIWHVLDHAWEIEDRIE